MTPTNWLHGATDDLAADDAEKLFDTLDEWYLTRDEGGTR